MSEEIFNLRTKISMDTVDFESGSQAVQREMKKLKSETKLVDADLKLYGRTSEGLGEKLKTLSKLENGHVIQIKEARAEYEKYRKEYELNGNTLDNNSKKMDAAINKETKAKAALASTRAEMGLLNTEILRNDSHLVQWGNSLTTSGNKINKFGKSMDGVANTWLRVSGVTLAATAGLVTAAVQWESSVASMAKTIDATPEQFDAMTQGIRDLALEIPTAAKDLAELASIAGQLGIDNENIVSFTKVVSQLGTATNMSAEQAATQFAKLANITGMSETQFSNLGSTVVELGNNFSTTESDITDMAMRLAGAGETVGLTEAEIMGLSTTLSSLGVEAEMGGSAISKLLVSMELATNTGLEPMQRLSEQAGLTRRDLELMASNSSKEFKALAESLGMTTTEMTDIMTASKNLENFAEIAGVSVEDFTTKFNDPNGGAIAAMQMFVGGLKETGTESESTIEKLDAMGISEIRMRDALLRLANGSGVLTDAISTANTAWSENTALQTEAEKRYATTESQLVLLKNKLMDVAISAGEELLPSLNNIVDSLDPLIDNLVDGVKWFSELDDSTKEMALQFAGFVVVGAPVLKTLAGITKAAGTLKTGFGTVVGALGNLVVGHKKAAASTVELSTELIATTGAASKAGGAAALFSNPWVLGIGAVALAAVGIGTLIYNEMTKDQKNHEQSVEDTKGKYQEWFDSVTEGANGMVSSQEQIQGAIKGTASTIAEETERLKEQNTLVTNAIDDLWNGGYQFNEKFWTSFNEPLTRNVDGIKDKLKDLKMSDEQISEIEASYNNYSLTVGNAMAEVLSTFTSGKAMTAELANATITANNAVTEEIVTSLTAQRDAEQANIEGMIAGGMITKAEYDKRSQENGMYYAILIQTTQNANTEINDIIATASRENRELTAAEVGSMLDSYTTLATNSGKSMTDIAEGQDMLGQNMRNMVSEVAIASLEQSGALSESATSQINSLGSVEEKVNALQWALDYYNRTGIPAKTINIDVSPALQAIADVQQAIYNLDTSEIYADVATNRVYTTASASGQQQATYAMGTNFHKGGLAILGDGGKREPFLTPDGRFGVSPAVDTMYNLPRGSKVWSSIQKFKTQASNNDYLKSFINQLPKFALGTQKSFLDSPKMPNVFGSNVQSTPSIIVNQTIISPDPIDARESARLSKINMQNLGYMLSRG